MWKQFSEERLQSHRRRFSHSEVAVGDEHRSERLSREMTRRLLPLLLTIHTKHAYFGEVYTAHGINRREAIAADSTSTTPRTCLASTFLYLDDGDLARTYSSSDVRTFEGVCDKKGEGSQ